jgi:hypothetical protein
MLWALLSAAAVSLFWLGYRRPRRRRWLLPRQAPASRANASPVDRQHQHLLAGGRLAEAAVAAAADRFRELLRNGRTAEVERALRPGIDFVVQVQALTRVGTAEASGVLERQLNRPLSPDPIEQTWYWADAASGLRQLRHAPALPSLLRCADSAANSPAGTVLAVEVVSFPNFTAAFSDLSGPLARSALRAIVRVARSCRAGEIEPGAMVAVGLGDMLAELAAAAPFVADPWLTEAILEAERLHRRIAYWTDLLPVEQRPVLRRQARRLEESARRRRLWLQSAASRLLDRFSIAQSDEQAAILRCLNEFRADVIALFPQLPDRRVAWWGEAMSCLRWSRSPVVGPVAARQVRRLLASNRTHREAAVMLASFRGQSCPEAERVLLQASTIPNAELRRAAASALGWQSPHHPALVLGALHSLRTDPHDDATRRGAIAALARLGVRSALEEIRCELHSEEAQIRAAAAMRVAAEGLSWLWPDLQDLADSNDRHTALAAVEAIERLREQALGVVAEAC